MDKLAINGGEPAFVGRRGKAANKIGVEEFLAIAARFGFSDQAMARLAATVSDADLPPGGPILARWACPYPGPPAGELYEAEARAKFGVPYALSVSSGTAALHASLVAIGAGRGDEVIVPALGFLATSMAVALVGATPVFCDVDESLQLDPKQLPSLVTERTVAVMPTHHWGGVADLAPVLDLASHRSLAVIEDCAQSPGATYQGRYVGTWGDLGCFSISAYKIIGGAEGGLILTSNQRLAERALQMAEGGGLWRPDRFAPERYSGELFPGTNYRLNDLEAAIDRVQLGKLDGIVERFRAVSRRLKSQLGDYPDLIWQASNDPDGDIGYLLRFLPASHEQAARIAAALRAEGIGAGHRGPDAPPDWHVYRHMYPLFGDHQAACGPSLCPRAADYYDRLVAVGVDQWWTPEDVDDVAVGLNKVLRAICGAPS